MEQYKALLVALAICAGVVVHGARAQTIDQMTARSGPLSTDGYECRPSGGPSYRCTAAQIATAGIPSTNALTQANMQIYPVSASSCTDTTINAAVTAAQSNGGGIIRIPAGAVCSVASTIAVSQSYIGFECAGPEGIHTGTVVPTSCSLKWTGASGGTIMSIIAPTGSTSDSFLTGDAVRGITFDGNAGLAANGLVIETIRNSDFRNLAFQSFNGGNVLYVGTIHATTSNFGDSCDTQFNEFDNIAINQFAGSSVGVYFDVWLNAAYENDGCGGTFNTFRNLDMGTSTGKGIVINGGDNNQFFNTRVYETTTTVHALEFDIVTNGSISYPANSNVFFHFTTNGVTYAVGQSTVPSCVAYTSSFGLTSCTQANKIYDLDVLDGAPAPTIETGAQLIYSYTTGATFNQQSGPLAIGQSAAQSVIAAGALGNASLQIYNASQDHIVLMDGTETWGVNINSTTENLKLVRGTGTASAVEMPGLLLTPSYTVATLPACASASAGQVVYVTDVSGTLVYNATISSGGSTGKILAVCNGANWVEH